MYPATICEAKHGIRSFLLSFTSFFLADSECSAGLYKLQVNTEEGLRLSTNAEPCNEQPSPKSFYNSYLNTKLLPQYPNLNWSSQRRGDNRDSVHVHTNVDERKENASVSLQCGLLFTLPCLHQPCSESSTSVAASVPCQCLHWKPLATVLLCTRSLLAVGSTAQYKILVMTRASRNEEDWKSSSSCNRQVKCESLLKPLHGWFRQLYWSKLKQIWSARRLWGWMTENHVQYWQPACGQKSFPTGISNVDQN